MTVPDDPDVPVAVAMEAGVVRATVDEAIVLDADALPALPTAEASEDFYNHVDVEHDTIRLDSTHIVSIRNSDEESPPNDRPQFSCVVLANRTDYADIHGTLGLTVRPINESDDALLQIAAISPDSVFAQTKIVHVGDILVSINNKTCRGKSPKTVFYILRAAVRPENPKATILLHNRGGDSSLVATAIEKTKPDQRLGISLTTNGRGGIVIQTIVSKAVAARSLLNSRDRILSVNDQDCTVVGTTPNEVAECMQKAPHFVTIVAETTGQTGVVIAAGSTRAIDAPIASSTPSAPEAHPGRKWNATRMALGLIMVIVVVIVGTIASNTESQPEVDPVPFTPPTPAPFISAYPTYSPNVDFIILDCNSAIPLSTDGTPAFDFIDASPANGPGSLECDGYFVGDHGRGLWYSFEAGLSTLFEVSTCAGMEASDTVLSIYSGSCQELSCVGFSDDSENLSCGLASSVVLPVEQGQIYYVYVQSYLGLNYGTTGVKAQPAFSENPCECFIASEPPVVSSPPAPSPSSPPIP